MITSPAGGGALPASPAPIDVDGMAADQPAAGEALRAARLARDLTIEDIAVETRIPARVLRAIEASDFADPGARPGAIAFGTTYARRLGVDEGRVAVAVRAALSRVATRGYTPIAGIEEQRDRHVAIAAAATLFIAFLIAVAGWCAWMLL
ncbi:helix-turn-helix transcriptional regulator [Sphingomonas sp. RT2P30]|uniref:helix-turn-helix domain-containing protein n=1 Tax=Parasphingomonas halimpatiens TaxID=3096162 RepID=UPI002FCB310A